MAGERLFIAKKAKIQPPSGPKKGADGIRPSTVIIHQSPPTTLPEALARAKRTLPNSWVEKKGKHAHIPRGANFTSKR